MKKCVCYFIVLSVFCFNGALPVQSSGISNSAMPEVLLSKSIHFAKAMTDSKKLKCFSATREQIFEDIYKYSLILQTGPGKYDRIGLYRIIKESCASTPIVAPKAIFMIHGDYSNFELFIMQSEFMPKDHSIGIYLAQKGIDVWGIDLRWSLLPEDVEDFSFMKNWNTKTHLGDIKVAVKLARIIRGFTGSGFGKIFLSGFSRGVQYVYAYANEETQLPRFLHDLKGIIPMDAQFKASPNSTEIIEAATGRYEVLKTLYDSGSYSSDEGLGLKYLAILASTAPDEMSETIPGFTNKEAILFIAAATFATFEPPEGPYTPNYHFTGGIFNEYGIPYDLAFTKYNYLLDIIMDIPSYQSLGEILEGEALLANIGDSPYDDYLAEIKIPVLYVGAIGGEGEYGEYTLSLLGSTDQTSIIVKLYPPEYIAADFGHLDLLSAGDADSFVWEPIYHWIKSH